MRITISFILVILYYISYIQSSRTNSLLNARKSNVQKKPNRQVKETESVVIASNIANSSDVFSHYDEKTKEQVLTYYGLMVAGAVARSVSATAVHPLNVIKTMLQTRQGKMPELTWRALTAGAGSQFIMSVPHGALSFAATETARTELARITANSTIIQKFIPSKVLNPLLDFLASSISTFICSVISTPQMVLSVTIMAGLHPNFFGAIACIAREEGLRGFYHGWLPALVQKIPSYAMTWTFFQQLKKAFLNFFDRAGTTYENTFLGSVAAAGACCVMIPVDTVKTRLVTQRPGSVKHYDGMMDCLMKIIREEGVGALYKALPPRLMSVVPMIGIQFGVYVTINPQSQTTTSP
jgi:hypothetical protein